MIRAIILVSLTGVLTLVLYVPAAIPAERLLALLRSEVQSAVLLWGVEPAGGILARAMTLHEMAGEPARASSAPVGSPGTVNDALAREVSAASQRLHDSAYLRSLDALLLLSAFRVSALLEWLPVLLVFTVVILLDGVVVRRLRSKEFRQHDPEMFAVHACLVTVIACGSVVLFVVPLSLHPALLPCLSVLISVPLGRSVGSFHRSA